MASWSKNTPSGNSSRRKWKLEDRASLNNLKYHIAEEGCSEVQYDLAKQLLNGAIAQNEANSNQQAVHWLICASQQGHENAVKLLRKCYIDNCGITTENETEVLTCLSMTAGERAARKAARELFACLSNGGEHITPKQLERKMREIYHMQKRRRRHGEAATSSSSEDEEDRMQKHSQAEIMSNGDGDYQRAVGNGELPHGSPSPLRRRGGFETATQRQARLTEENLVSAAVNYAAGRLPDVALTLSVPNPSSLDHVPCFHRLLFHPIIFITLLYHRLINLIGTLPNSVPANVRLPLLFLSYWLAARDNLTVYLPLFFYYGCWGVMVWATCKMLKTKHDFVDFRIWSGLFLSYGDHNIEANMSEHRFLKNNMKPFLYFFGAFVGNLLTYPLIDVTWLPHSELTIVSCVCMFLTLFVFMYSSAHSFPDWVLLFSFGINVMAKYPYEMDEVVSNSWRFLDLKVPTFCSFVVGNGIEFCLNCRGALYLFIPGFLVHLAKRSNWHGIYTYLIPHCVTLSWLQLCILSSQNATMFGMVRAALGLAGILLFLPLFGIISLLIPLFVAIDWLGFTDPDVRLGSTVVAGVLTLLGSCFMAINRNTQKYITIIQIAVFIIASCVLTLPYMTSSFKDNTRFGKLLNEQQHAAVVADHHHHFSWQRYYDLCGPTAWQHENQIKAQLRCAHLNGMPINWEGMVSHARISRVSNTRAKYVSQYLPTWLANLLRCLFGERISHELKCDVLKDEYCANLQDVLAKTGIWNGCSLHKWNSYEYEIHVRMPAGLLSKGFEIVLQASDKFGNFTQKLAAGDRIQFYGLLQNSRILANNEQVDYVLGSAQPIVQLNAIECLFCMDKTIEAVSIESAKSPVDARLRDLMRGIKYLLNVLFNPLITFK